jgi:chloramphenicol 3-O-phosphotransferase
VDVTGGIGGRSFFGPASKIRDVTYQGLVNVVEAVRANRFGGRIVLLSGMGADRPSLAGAILNAIKGNLQKNMVDRERFWKAAGSTTRCAEALSLPTSLAGSTASGSQPRRIVLISGAGSRGPTSPAP